MYFILINKGAWQLKGTEQETNLEKLSKHVSVQFWPNMLEYSFGLTFRLNGILLPSAWTTRANELRIHLDSFTSFTRYNISIGTITRDFNKVLISRDNALAHSYVSLATGSDYDNAKILHAIIDVLVEEGIIEVNKT